MAIWGKRHGPVLNGAPLGTVDPGSAPMDASPVEDTLRVPIQWTKCEAVPIRCHSSGEYMVYWPLGFP